MKTDIKELTDDVIDCFEAIHPKMFRYKAGPDGEQRPIEFGYIAQELYRSCLGPLLNITESDSMKKQEIDDPEDGYQLRVSYDKVAVLLHASIKRILARLDKLERAVLESK